MVALIIIFPERRQLRRRGADGLRQQLGEGWHRTAAAADLDSLMTPADEGEGASDAETQAVRTRTRPLPNLLKNLQSDSK
jgi:hypothetical protein